MPSIDNRIVQMRFDNQDFESGVSESISSLDKLKRSLKLKDETEGFDELGNAAGALSKKLTALGTIGDQVLRNLGNEIYGLKNKMLGLVKSLSLDQIASGWDKYAVKTSAVQTIMSATADEFANESEQMAAVNEQLDRLNWFTDETSFKLVDMVSNIGRFTSNGQNLETSVTAMQGIATWAGLSGANAEQASRAMNNLSQALALGAVRVQDWQSIETANMATKEFKEIAMETAVELGTLKKTADGLYQTLDGKEKFGVEGFRGSLQKNWFTGDVLMKTLNQYGSFTDALYAEMEKAEYKVTTSKMLQYVDEYAKGTLDIQKAAQQTGISIEELAADLKNLGKAEFALGRKAFEKSQEAKTFEEAIDSVKDAVSSKWMQTFEIIFGDYEKARKLWTNLANELWDIFAAGGDLRNEMLSEWADQGGYDKLWEAIWNLWDGIKGIGTRISEAIHRLLPDVDTDKLLTLTDKLLDFSIKFKERFAIVEDTIEDAVDRVAETRKKLHDTFEFTDDIAAADRKLERYKDHLKSLYTFENPVDDVTPIKDSIDSLDEETQKYIRTLQDLDQIEKDVWSGKYEGGEGRQKNLEKAGYSYEIVQNKINEVLGSQARLAVSDEKLEKATKIVNGELKITSDTSGTVSDAMDELSDGVEHARDWLDDLSDVLHGFKSGLDLFIEVGKVLNKHVVKPLTKGAVNLFKKLLADLAPFSRAFSDFVEKVKETNALESLVLKIKGWFHDLGEYLKKQDNIKQFLKYIQEFKTSIAGVKESALQKFTEFLDKIATGDINLPSVEKIGNFIDRIAGGVNDVIGFIKNAKEFLSGLDFSGVEGFASSAATGLSTFLQTLFEDKDLKEAGRGWLRQLIDGILDEAGKIKLGPILGGILGVGATRALWGFTAIPKALADALWGVWEIGKGVRTFMAGKFIKDVAIAIGILAASLLALSLIPRERLSSAVGTIMLVMGVFSLIAKNLLNKATTLTKDESKGIGSLKSFFIAFSAAILIMAVSIRILSKIPVSNLWKAIGAMTAIMLLMVATGALMKLIVQTNKRGYASYGEEMKQFALFFVVLAAATLLILPAIVTLTGLAALPNNLLWKAIGAFAVILASMTVLVAALSLVGKSINKDESSKTGTLFALAALLGVLVIALNLIMPAIVTLTGLAALPNDVLTKAIISLVALLLSLSIAVALLNKIKLQNNALTIIGLSTAILLLVAALDLIMPALLTLSSIAKGGLGTYLAVILGIIVLLGALTGVLAILSKIKSENIGKNVLAIMGLSTALLIIAASLKALKGSTFKELMSIVGAISILMGVMVLLGAIMTKIPGIDSALIGLGVGLAAIGAALLLVGVGALAFAKAIQLLSDASVDAKAAGKNLAEGVIAFFDELVQNGQSILKFIGMLISAVIAVIMAKKANLIEAGATLVKGFLAKVTLLLVKSKGALIIVLAVLIAGILEYLGAEIDVVIDAILKILILVINGIAKGILNNAHQMWQAIMNVVYALMYLVLDGIATIIDSFLALFGVDTEQFGLHNLVDSWLKPEETVAKIDESTRIVTKALEDDGKQLTDGAKNYAESHNEATGILGSLGSIFGENNEVDPTKAILAATDSVTINGREISGALLSEIQNGLRTGDITPEELGEYINQGMADGITDSQDLVVTALNGMDTEAIAAMFTDWDSNSPSKVSEKLGGYVDEGFAIGVRNNVKSVQDAIKFVSALAIHGLNNLITSMNQTGKDAVQGFVNGMKSYSYLVDAQSRTLGRTAYYALRESIDAHSPSKMTEELGLNFDQGFANSINENSDLSTRAAQGMGEATLSAFNSVIQRIQDAIDGDWDLSPVIRPVLDLSEIQNGQGRIGSFLGTGSYHFMGNLDYSREHAMNVQASTNTFTGREIMLTQTISDMQTQIGELTSQNMSMMQIMKAYMPYIPEVANMQMVTDRGALVGELAPMMNQKLGIIAAKNRKR